jgi:hypothetical protein
MQLHPEVASTIAPEVTPPKVCYLLCSLCDKGEAKGRDEGSLPEGWDRQFCDTCAELIDAEDPVLDEALEECYSPKHLVWNKEKTDLVCHLCDVKTAMDKKGVGVGICTKCTTDLKTVDDPDRIVSLLKTL